MNTNWLKSSFPLPPKLCASEKSWQSSKITEHTRSNDQTYATAKASAEHTALVVLGTVVSQPFKTEPPLTNFSKFSGIPFLWGSGGRKSGGRNQAVKALPYICLLTAEDAAQNTGIVSTGAALSRTAHSPNTTMLRADGRGCKESCWDTWADTGARNMH